MGCPVTPRASVWASLPSHNTEISAYEKVDRLARSDEIGRGNDLEKEDITGEELLTRLESPPDRYRGPLAMRFQEPEKRKFSRFPVTAPVICSRYGRQMTMRTLDISQGGLKLEANFELAVGESMDFVILINGTRIRCRGKILAIEELNHKVQARLRFTRTSSSEQRKLSDYLHTLYWGRRQKWVIGGIVIVSAFMAYFIIRAYFFL